MCIVFMEKEIKKENENKEAKQETSNEEQKDILQKAEELAVRIEKANEETKKLMEEQKNLNSRLILGGKSQSGQVQKTNEELEKEKVEAEVKRLQNRFNIGRK